MEEVLIVSFLEKVINIGAAPKNSNHWTVSSMSYPDLIFWSYNGVREPGMCRWERLRHLTVHVLVGPNKWQRHLPVCCVCERIAQMGGPVPFLIITSLPSRYIRWLWGGWDQPFSEKTFLDAWLLSVHHTTAVLPEGGSMLASGKGDGFQRSN